MGSRVRIGTCSGPADAALVRSVFTAHEIDVVIGAEHHASLLGPVGSAFLSLDIWVAGEDAEEAAALLHDLRERSARTATGAAEVGEEGEDDGDEDGDENADEDADDDADEDAAAAPPPPSAPGESLRWRLGRRRRAGAVLLLGAFLTFGTAHMFTRAWGRGLALAGLEILGFYNLAVGNPGGGAVVACTILFDLVGALWRVQTAPRTTLPVARVRVP